MFGAIKQTLKNAQTIDEGRAWLFAIDKNVQEQIIELNTEVQLYDFGIDSKGNSLGEYSPLTKIIKLSKGQRIDHVTLKDTEAFYDSFFVFVDTKGFTIIADDVAFYDRPLTDVYGIDILGLTEENTNFLIGFITDNLKQYVRDQLLR